VHTISPASCQLESRHDTAVAVASLLGMRDALAAIQDYCALLAHHVAANQVPAPLGATGWDVQTFRTLTRRKTQHTLQSHVHECRVRSVWPTRNVSIADFSLMDLIDETQRTAITTPGASAFLGSSARYHLMNTGVLTLAIARRLGVSVFRSPAICSACDAPMDSHGDHALLFYGSGPVSRGHMHCSLMHVIDDVLRDANFRSEREKYGLLPDTQAC
jgi:hypothetical protein